MGFFKALHFSEPIVAFRGFKMFSGCYAPKKRFFSKTAFYVQTMQINRAFAYINTVQVISIERYR